MKVQLRGNSKVQIDPEEPEVKALMKEFDEEFFQIRFYGGHTRIGELDYGYYHDYGDLDANGKPTLKKEHQPHLQTREIYHFEQAYTDASVTIGYTKYGKPIKATKSKVWLSLPHRTYEGVVFHPGGPPEIWTDGKKSSKYDCPDLNLWQGFAYEAKKGDCSLYLDHLRDNICRHNTDHYRILLAWMADAVQHPERHGNWAVVVGGKKGTGKNIFAEAFMRLFGTHGLVVSGERSVVSNFNAQMHNKCVLVADEAFFSQDPRQDRVLKGMITGNTLRIEPKGVDSFMVENFLHVIIIGNDRQLVYATLDERRYFALECGDEHRQDDDYFRAIIDQLKSGGYSALLYHLLNEVDATIPRDAPQTDVLKAQMSLPPTERMWLELLDRGWLPSVRPVNKDGSIDVQVKDILDWAGKQRRRGFSDIRHQDVHDLIVKRLGIAKPKTVSVDGNKLWALRLPRLRDSRQHWDARTGYQREWDGIDTEWESDARYSGLCSKCHKYAKECRCLCPNCKEPVADCSC